MPKTSLACTITLLSLVFITGCTGEEAPPPPETVEPAPPTATEIQQELTTAVQPVVTQMQQKAPLGAAQIEPNIKNLQTSVNKFRGTPNAPEAFKTAAGQLKNLLRQAHRDEQWWYVVYFFEALNVVDRPSAEDVKKLRDDAQRAIDRPKPTITGFFKDEGTGQITVFLQVLTPNTGETHNVRARIGDEFNNLRMIEIIGDNKCVEFEYLVDQSTFQVCTEAARQSR